MYIAIGNMKKSMGKYIEMTDLYIGIPMLMSFLILFAFTPYKMFSLIYLTICVFLMIPINLSKKNRMYKVIWLCFKYIFRSKEYILRKES